MKKVRFALLGVGRISSKHIEALSSLNDQATITSVCDTDSVALETAVKKTGAQGFANLSDMLSDGNLDVVSICTPSGLHAEQGQQVALAGFHVLTEKPMATRFEDGLKLTEICQKEKVKLFVVKQNRFNRTNQLLKQAVDQGRFGKIYMITSNVFWTRPQDYYNQASWRGTWKWDGGAFMNQASHYVDMMGWFGGDVDYVYADIATLARKIEAEDTGVATLKYKSGALGSINVTMLTHPQNLEGSITILGEKGTARIGGPAMNEIIDWNFSDEREEDKLVNEASYKTKSVYGFGHSLYYKNVIDSLSSDKNPAVDGQSGLQSLALLSAIYNSAKSGERVYLDKLKG